MERSFTRGARAYAWSDVGSSDGTDDARHRCIVDPSRMSGASRSFEARGSVGGSTGQGFVAAYRTPYARHRRGEVHDMRALAMSISCSSKLCLVLAWSMCG